jgi:internalin A
MASSKLLVVNLSAISSTAAGAVNLTDAKINSNLIAGPVKFQAVEGVANGQMQGVCTDNSGNIYIADINNHCILKVTESGVGSVLAGKPGTSGNNTALQNVTAANARFNAPRGIACDKSGNIYVADTGNNQIRIIRQNGLVGMFAGNGARTAGLVDASRDPTQAQFSAPYGVAVDNSGVVWVADYGNRALRKIFNNRVLTVAGNGSNPTTSQENVAAKNNTAQLRDFNALAVDAKQNVFLSDSYFYKIKKYTPNGWLYLHSGSGTQGTALGTAYTCRYEGPVGMVTDRYGYLYVLDKGTKTRVVKVDPNGKPSNVVTFNESSYETNVYGIGISPSNKVFVTIWY